MRVPDSVLLPMFERAGVQRARLHYVLRTMGRRHLSHAGMEWSPSNPTRNYCYVVSEWVHRYRLPRCTPMALDVAGDAFKHRFLIVDGRDVVDLTCDQFADYACVVHANARPLGFMQSGGPQPSARAQLVEHLYQGRSESTFVGSKALPVPPVPVSSRFVSRR